MINAMVGRVIMLCDILLNLAPSPQPPASRCSCVVHHSWLLCYPPRYYNYTILQSHEVNCKCDPLKIKGYLL